MRVASNCVAAAISPSTSSAGLAGAVMTPADSETASAAACAAAMPRAMCACIDRMRRSSAREYRRNPPELRAGASRL